MDNYTQDEEILDLRAEFYDKYYVPKTPYTTLKFIKEGKVVSHWAKAYRGKVLRELSQANIQSIESLLALNIDGLTLDTQVIKKHKTEIIYTIDS
ncbi:MAG: peroxide stress protein YaaA [Sulfurovum sp.]|nr:peroxide stress protein YaaA [Sulfurovum sp.]